MDTSKNKEENNLTFFCEYCDSEVDEKKAIRDGDNLYCDDDCLGDSYLNEEV